MAVEKIEGSVVCTIVGTRMEDGASQLRSRRRHGIILRGVLEVVVGVSISRVRTVSRGERMVPAMPAAAIAIVRERSGDGESMISRPPTPGDAAGKVEVEETPGSGRLRIAASILRVQVSSVRRRRE